MRVLGVCAGASLGTSSSENLLSPSAGADSLRLGIKGLFHVLLLTFKGQLELES